MNLIKSSFFLILALSIASSCQSIPASISNPTSDAAKKLIALEGNLRTKGGYDSYLALEYLSFARKLFSVKAEKTSNHFINKGLDVAHGKMVVPENPLNWNADPAQIEEMVLMQKRLEMALEEPHIKFYLPVQMAHLTYLYDCWMSRESQAAFRSEELAQCRNRFGKLLDEVESFIDYQKRDRQPKVTITEPEFDHFKILFDLGIFKLNNHATGELIKVLDYLKTLNGNYKILLVGNADRTGSDLLNQNLALNRADVVQNYFLKNGVPKDLVAIRSFGENLPDIVTRNGVQQQTNRAVDIYVIQGLRSFESIPLPLIINEVYRKGVIQARKQRGL